MMRASPTASEQETAGAIASGTPAVDRNASALTVNDQERSRKSLKMRPVFKCTNLALFRPPLLSKTHELIATLTFKAPSARAKDVTPWKIDFSVSTPSK